MRNALFLVVAAALAAPAVAKTRTKNMLETFEQGKLEDRVRVAPAMGRSRDKRATDLLLEAYNPRKSNPRETLALTEALGLSADKRAIPPLQAAWDYMRTADMQMEGELPGHLQALRLRILEAFARVGGPEAIAVLSTAVNDADPRVVAEAAKGLGLLRVKDAIPALQQLAVKGGNVGQSAIEALADIGDKRAINTLEQLLTGSDKLVDAQARYALARLGQKGYVASLEKTLEGDPGDGKAAILSAYYLVKLDKNSGITYLDTIARKHGDPLAPLAVEALGKTDNPRAVQPVVEAMSAPEAPVRLMCAQALARLGGARAVSALKKLRQDSNVGVRAQAILGLNDWGEFD